MKGDKIWYQQGYKYQLFDDYLVRVGVTPDYNLKSSYIELDTTGLLTIKQGYAWDGPSGPTVDTSEFMRGSLVHDALYQLMRMGFLDYERHRKLADIELRKICREDGMTAASAWLVYQGVRFGGLDGAHPRSNSAILCAPVDPPKESVFPSSN